MRIGRKYDYHFLSADDWLQFAADSRLPVPAVQRLIREVIDRVRNAVDDELGAIERKYGTNPICKEIADLIKQRAAILEKDVGLVSAA